MWAVETLERDKEHGLWREIRNVGCGDCGEIEGMWSVEIVETYKECGLWRL